MTSLRSHRQLLRRLIESGASIVLALLAGENSSATAPVLFHTPNFESPVRGGPDELLFIGGLGFQPGDRVVYQRVNEAEESVQHPEAVPAQSTPELGLASVVKVADPPYALTALLPQVFAADAVYRVWVVNAASEWSLPFTINDSRPLWFSPDHVYATGDFAGLHRKVRVVGRNLNPVGAAQGLQIRLQGRQTYLLNADKSADAHGAALGYVTEALLPQRIAPGIYTLSVSRGGTLWAAVPEQKLTVLADPGALPRFVITESRFGACQPDDDRDDSGCLSSAITAAREAGGGIVEIPAGTWDLYAPARDEAQFVLTADVHLQGAGAAATTMVRHAAPQDRVSSPLLLLEGNNSVSRLKFIDDRRFGAIEASRAVIQLGHRWDDSRVRSGELPGLVRNITISDNLFRRVGMAVVDAGLPIEQLFITHNDFGGYAGGLRLTGISHGLVQLFRIDDAVVRWNRFVPGSYIDMSVGQGAIASELGASRRVDFSSNDVDGASTEALQDPHDQPGFRAAFFWNMRDSEEMLLLQGNRISCSGDKAGDGEAVAFDGNGYTFGYQQAAEIAGSTARSVTVRGALEAAPNLWAGGRDSYYVGHWVQVVAGPGLGQTRKIQRYHSDGEGRSVVFEVAPAWDVEPAAGDSRVIVARQFWQTYVIDNEITQATPTCRKSNLSGPRGGKIIVWAPSADSVIAGNRQFDTSGLEFTQNYSVKTPSCPACSSYSALETALEIRGNLLRGEYDWSSDCSLSGIQGTFGASPTPEAPPPTVSFGVQVVHNVIEHADGLRGGAIDIVPTWYKGPEPRKWRLIDNLILSHNRISDIEGPVPRGACRYGPFARVGIRIEGAGDVVDTVLYDNRCEKTATPLVDTGTRTARICRTYADDSCECRGAIR